MKTLFYNGTIMTMDPVIGDAESLLVEEDSIQAVGTYKELKSSKNIGRRINLQGKVVLPGFIDNHTHFYQYLKEESSISLSKALSLRDIGLIIGKNLPSASLFDDPKAKNQAVSHPGENCSCWIVCSNLEQHRISDYDNLDRFFLDSITRVFPLVILSKDHHTICCNSLALRIIGIEKSTPEPPGGKIGRLSDGTPDGFLYEKAWVLLYNVLKKSEKSELESLSSVLNKLYRLGITGLHTMENYDTYIENRDSFINRLRVCWHIYDDDIDKVIENNHISYQGNEFTRFGTIKTFLDGTLGSGTALLSLYPDKETASENYLTIDEEELTELVLKCRRSNLGLSFHSIGDKSTKIILNILNRIYGDKQAISPMIRFEHLQFIDVSSLNRIKKHGIYCSLQPNHMDFDIPLIEKRYSKMRNLAYPLSSFFTTGCKTGFGSDAPIADINPFTGIYCAITRNTAQDSHIRDWTPQYLLSPEQAVYGYTAGAAEGSLSHSRLGTLKPEKLADLIVIDDFRKESPEFWLDAHSYLTMINGDIKHNEIPF